MHSSPGRQVRDSPMPPLFLKSISKFDVKEWCQYKEFANLEELRTVCSVPVSWEKGNYNTKWLALLSQKEIFAAPVNHFMFYFSLHQQTYYTLSKSNHRVSQHQYCLPNPRLQKNKLFTKLNSLNLYVYAFFLLVCHLKVTKVDQYKSSQDIIMPA